MFIDETTIDSVVENLEQADFEAEIADFSKRYPLLLNYLFSEDFELLTQEEREYLLYLALVVTQSVEKARGGSLLPLSKKALEDAEERNWEILDGVTAKRFRDRLDPFFHDTPQEDLLAFVEDALADDEDGSVTKEGREPIFIALKSIIDVLTR